jgi:DNA processing protein
MDGLGACTACLRRSWLLGRLSACLDYWCRDRSRLMDLLALEDDELLAAVGGSRRAELASQLSLPARQWLAPAGDGERRLCRHDPRFPDSLRGRSSPRMLFLAGAPERLGELTRAPVVALLGSRTPSDHGIEVAVSLARGLAAAGVSVVAGPADGIAAASLRGAADAGGATILATAGGLRVPLPARRRSLYEHLDARGCRIAELPGDCDGRRFGELAAERLVVELARLAVVVEARDSTGELAAAEIARSLGHTVAAVPGRVTSLLSAGPNALLREGAPLVRGAEDALELLDAPGAARGSPSPAPDRAAAAALAPHLRPLFELVCGGRDTVELLCREGADPGEVLSGLSELELAGLLGRGHGGRYLPRVARSR